MFHIVRMMVCLGCLSGCLGSAETEALSAYQSKSLWARDIVEPLEDMSLTTPFAMPTSGTASFQGVARLVIDPDPDATTDDIRLIGESTIHADFAVGATTGTLTNFAGVTDISAVDATATTAVGQIDIGQTLSGIGPDPSGTLTDRPNEWYADYSGSLQILGKGYAIDGVIVGDFVGTPNQPVVGVVGRSRTGMSVQNGQTGLVTLNLAADR